ncbi:MAG TPA: ABC transporter permease [Candidatus Udaeobacter sp.]|nr:ABC transporter permease [Candidatus Udaeobacter sp.]
MKNFVALTRMRIHLALRNKMFFFFVLVMPFAFFFIWLGVFAKGLPQMVAFYLGPVLAFNVMGSFWGLSATLVTFREQGILRRFHVAPVTASDLLASSIVANFVLTIPTVLVELFLARVLFHVPSLGNPISLFLLISVGIISFGSLGLVVASVTNTMQETQVLNQLLWLPLIFLSGATFPLAFLPRTVQRFGLFLPATYLVNGLQQTIVNSATAWSRYAEILSLAVWACLTFFLSAQLFRWEPEARTPRRAKLLVAATAIPFLLLGVVENRTDRILLEAKSAFLTMTSAMSAPGSGTVDSSRKPGTEEKPSDLTPK